MSNKAIITREQQKLSSDAILGPPFLYDPFEFGITFLFRYQGTILPLVLSSPLFWFLVASHIAMLWAYHSVHGREPVLDWKAAVVPSSLLTFLLVSYSNQCFARYFQLHQHCILLHGCIMDWVALIKQEFGHKDKGFRWNLLRLMLGGLQVHYALLGGDDVDTDGNVCKGISEDEWRAIRARQLLSRAEIASLSVYHGFVPFLPVTWALNEVKAGYLNCLPEEAAERHIPDGPTRVAINQFRTLACSFRSHSSLTFDLLNAPTPFAYFHVMKLLLLLSVRVRTDSALPLPSSRRAPSLSRSLSDPPLPPLPPLPEQLLIISYALIELLGGQTLLCILVFSLTALVMVGLAEIAIAMSDPFGDDQADFNVRAGWRIDTLSPYASHGCSQRARHMPHIPVLSYSSRSCGACRYAPSPLLLPASCTVSCCMPVAAGRFPGGYI
jgi:hypothetical protein